MTPDVNFFRPLSNDYAVSSTDITCLLISYSLIIKNQIFLSVNFRDKYLDMIFIQKVLGGIHNNLLEIRNIHKIQIFCYFQT